MSPKKGKLKFNSTEESPLGSGNNTSSVAAFSQTLHPITKANCTICHGVNEAPLHAVDDAQQAHDAVVNAGKVNMSNPGQSRMVLKLINENHNCGTNCASWAAQMETAITTWNSMLANNGNNNGDDEPNRTADSPPLITILDPNNNMDNGTLVLDPESGSLVAPMVAGVDGEIDFIHVPDNGANLANNDATAGIGYINFNSTISDNYKVYGFVDAPGNGDNSFHIKIDNGAYNEWHITETEGFEWRELTNTANQNPVSIFLPAGNGHIFEVRQREDGTKISQVVVTNDPNVDLNAVSTAVIGTLTYDLSMHLNQNIQFQIDVQEFDDFSYKFSNPRMLTNGANVYVKDIKIYINRNWNAQHSTYTVVDKIVTPADSSLSPHSMIVLKDLGPQFDLVGFSFEILTVQ